VGDAAGLANNRFVAKLAGVLAKLPCTENKSGWQNVCTGANELVQADSASIRAFFEENFTPYQVYNPMV